MFYTFDRQKQIASHYFKHWALEKITAVDDMLEPGLLKKYFRNDSLTDMFKQLRNLIENKSKISAKNIKMSLIEAGLIKLKM